MNDARDDEEEPGLLQTLAQPAVRNYVFIGFAALIVYYALMADRYNDIGALITVCIALPGLILRWIISPILFLIIFSYILIDPNFSNIIDVLQVGSRIWSRSYWGDRLFSDILLSASVLIYLMANFRVLSFVHKSMPDDPPPRRKGQPEPESPRRPFKLFTEREIAVLLGVGLFSVIVGALSWRILSGYERSERLGGEWGISRRFARVMLFLWSIGTVAVLTGTLFRYLALRRMNRLEARLMLQDGFWQETRREQERIYRWRNWKRSARSARRGNRTVSTPSQNSNS
jgi:hypothetical protein